MCMMRRHGWGAFAVMLALAGWLLSGCTYYLGPGSQEGEGAKGGGEVVDDDTGARGLTVVVETTRAAPPYYPGDVLSISWSPDAGLPAVTIHLFEGDEPALEIAASHTGGVPYQWTIPEGLAPSETYRIRVTGPSEGKGEDAQGFSETFAIVARIDTGLSDVTVTQRQVTLTVTDNGSLVDGDTIDIRLNGNTVVVHHVLVGPPGTAFLVSLQGGANLLDVVAINEGTVGPNTAQLSISNVTVGEAVQVWRLSAPQTGSLTISAPY